MHAQPDAFDHQEISTNISTENGHTKYYENDEIKINYKVSTKGGACGDWDRDMKHAYSIKIPSNISIKHLSIIMDGINLWNGSYFWNNAIQYNTLNIYLKCTKENNTSITNISYTMRCPSDRSCPKDICLSNNIGYGTNLNGYFTKNNISIKILSAPKSNSPPSVSNLMEKNNKITATSNDTLTFIFMIRDNDSNNISSSLCANGSIIGKLKKIKNYEAGTLIQDNISVHVSELALGLNVIQANVSDGENFQLSLPTWNITVNDIPIDPEGTKKTASIYVLSLNIALIIIINAIILKEMSNKEKNWRSHLRCISAYNACLVTFAMLLMQSTNSILSLYDNFLTRLTVLGIIAGICLAARQIIGNDPAGLKDKNKFLGGGIIFLLLFALLAPDDLIFCMSIVCIIQLNVPIIAYLHISK